MSVCIKCLLDTQSLLILTSIIQNAFFFKNGNRRYKYLVLGHEETYFMKEHSDSKSKYSEDDIIKMLEFLVDNIFVSVNKFHRECGNIYNLFISLNYWRFGRRPFSKNEFTVMSHFVFLHSQSKWSPKPSGFCRKSLPADSRHSNGYELCPSSRRHLSVFIRSGFHTIFALYGKEIFSISVQSHTSMMYCPLTTQNSKYPAELEIKDTAESTTSASYLDLILSIGRDGQLHTSIYDKRDNFNFHITNFPFLSSNIPSSPAYGVFISQLIRYARACSSYECFVLRARRLSGKLLKQVYLVERLKSSFRKFYGRYGDLIEQYGVTLSRMLNDILTLDQQWLPYRSDFPPISWPLYRAWPSPNYEWFSICNGCG